MQWNPIRHRVAIAGRVTDAQTHKAIADAEVAIAKAPEPFNHRLSLQALQHGDRWEAMTERPDRTRTANDGHFHFLDLPSGEYQLTASLPSAGRRYGRASLAVKVARDRAEKNVITEADLALPPTCLKGQILDRDADPIVLAKVRLQYSEETTFSAQNGQYLLGGIEASRKIERTAIVSAQGYQIASEIVILDEPGLEKTINFVLRRN